MDRDLVEQVQRGDREAYAVLARAYSDRLFAIAQRILRDIDLAEDALQQTLVIAWRELPRIRDLDRFEAWLQRTLINACYLEARKRRVWSANVRVLPIDGPADRRDVGSTIDQPERGPPPAAGPASHPRHALLPRPGTG
jgi:RNA polymerase sigma-70 factor (ECF subfamily)